MIKKNWKLLLVTSIVILLPILAGLALWRQLPEQVPMHWNAKGEIDGWGSKTVFVFVLPAALLGFQWLCVLGTLSDPKKANHSEKILHLVFWIIPVLSILLSVLTYFAALGKDVQMEMVMPIFMGLIFVIIGNYLPKCKQSYTIGIKIPWTLNSEENWNRTHRFAGWLWTFCGIGMMIAGLFGVYWIFFVAVFVMVLPPVIYSYLLYKKGI